MLFLVNIYKLKKKNINLKYILFLASIFGGLEMIWVCTFMNNWR